MIFYEEQHKKRCRYCNPESLSDDILCFVKELSRGYQKLEAAFCKHCKNKEAGIILYKKYTRKNSFYDYLEEVQDWIHFAQNGYPICELTQMKKL